VDVLGTQAQAIDAANTIAAEISALGQATEERT
jgi:hypothetical protein